MVVRSLAVLQISMKKRALAWIVSGIALLNVTIVLLYV
jgi:hypothetical protein